MAKRAVPVGLAIGSLAFASFFAPPAAEAGGQHAQHAPGTPGTPAAQHAQHAPDARHVQHAHRHHVSLFLGMVDNRHLHEQSPTGGVGYRYALGDRFAIGSIADFAFFEEEKTTVLIAAAFWKPAGGLVLLAGPGIEVLRARGDSHDPHAGRSGGEHVEAAGNQTRFAFRVGADYELRAGRFTIAPGVSADFAGGHTTLVYGVDFGIGF